jgi:hypothetical protein
MTISEKKYLAMVAALGCCRCGSEAEIHHIRQFQGMGQRASNYLTIPLCPVHHRTGRDSIHQNTMMEGKYLSATIEAIFSQLLRERMPF